MSKSHENDIAFIRALAEVLRENDLSEIEVAREYGDDDVLSVRLSRESEVQYVAQQPVVQAQPVPQASATAAPASAPAPAAAPPSKAADGEVVASPMVGTSYLSPEPNSDPFVQIGDQVAEGDTLMIIEAMKTMNQIPSPRAGKVIAIHVANGEPVEFGAPLVTLG